jgi:RNA recognition motif-containing protein
VRALPGFDPEANADAAVPYHRLYLQNVAYTLTEADLRAVFEPFGEIVFVDQHVDNVSAEGAGPGRGRGKKERKERKGEGGNE